ncbi:flagellar hook-length control protein FliK [Methylophaga sp.]|uniref:flagellar hook-length control protein FliK n=1 Tax=Methylophaga sp. TaxID=2024840 RepID=UPI003F6A2978
MQINSSQQNSAEVVRDVPARLLASLAEGERVQATVVARLTANAVKLQVADTTIQVTTQQPLVPGQKIELQRSIEAGRAVLKIVPAETLTNPSRPDAAQVSLKAGQQVAIEVIKLLAQNRLLVTPSLLNASNPARNINANTAQVLSQALPRQIEVDVSALKQTFKIGDKLALEVLQTQPLAIKLSTNSPTRAETIQNYQRILLPQIERQAGTLPTLNQSVTDLTLPAPVRQEINRLFQGLTEKNALQQPEALKQTINKSGVFLESFLKTNQGATQFGQDFKANLLQLAQVLKQQVQQPFLNRVVDNPGLMKQLPNEVQTALRQLVTTPQDLRPLPAQVPPALASKGQTPMQLLLGLLSGLRGAVVNGENPLLPSSLTSTHQGQNLSGVQAFINARDSQAAQAHNAVRSVEWQMLRDLLREVESASARIQFNQLSMVRDADLPNNVNVWLFDLPVKDKQQLEMLQLRLEQHSPDLSRGEDAIWQVQLNLETQNLGPMQARISLHKQDVKVVILAERQASVDVLSQHIDDLNTRLQKLDVSISHLSCRQAVIKPLTADIQPRQGDRLLDISV